MKVWLTLCHVIFVKILQTLCYLGQDLTDPMLSRSRLDWPYAILVKIWLTLYYLGQDLTDFMLSWSRFDWPYAILVKIWLTMCYLGKGLTDPMLYWQRSVWYYFILQEQDQYRQNNFSFRSIGSNTFSDFERRLDFYDPLVCFHFWKSICDRFKFRK